MYDFQNSKIDLSKELFSSRLYCWSIKHSLYEIMEIIMVFSNGQILAYETETKII